MAFENAIITKEDDEKYGLSKIFYQYSPYHEELPRNFVVDRQKDIWFLLIERLPNERYDYGYGSKKLWRLYIQGNNLDILLDYEYDQEVDGRKFQRVWKIIEVNVINSIIPDNEVIKILRDILIDFKFRPGWEDKDDFSVALIDVRKKK